MIARNAADTLKQVHLELGGKGANIWFADANVDAAVNGTADLHEVLAIPALHLGSLPGLETTVVSFTTDIPAFGNTWGKPYLLGPGTIHVAHTSEERIPKTQLIEAVQIYKTMVKQRL